MNEISAALRSTLGGDSTLTSLLGGTAIFHLQAPDEYAYPYVVFSWQGGGVDNQVRDLRDSLEFIRCYHTDEAAAGTIDARIKALLHNQAVSITGWSTVTLHREDDYETVEINPNKTKTFVIGGIYRFILDQ